MNRIIYIGLNVIVTSVVAYYLIGYLSTTNSPPIKKDDTNSPHIKKDDTNSPPIKKDDISLSQIHQSLIKDDVASKTYKTYTKFVKTTFDTLHINVYENEKKWLLHLQSSPYFPKLLYYDDEMRMLITTNIGTRVTAKHLSKINIPEQIDKILAELRKFNCRHNDIKPSELVIKNNRLNLVDFGWAHEYDQPNPECWPACLGDIFKCEPYDDEGSLKKSIEHIRLNPI